MKTDDGSDGELHAEEDVRKAELVPGVRHILHLGAQEWQRVRLLCKVGGSKSLSIVARFPLEMRPPCLACYTIGLRTASVTSIGLKFSF